MISHSIHLKSPGITVNPIQNPSDSPGFDGKSHEISMKMPWNPMVLAHLPGEVQPRHIPGIFTHGPRPRTSAAQKRISLVDEEDQASPDT